MGSVDRIGLGLGLGLGLGKEIIFIKIICYGITSDEA